MTGAERIERALREAGRQGRLGFVPYVTAGDPDLDATERIAEALARGGADVLELGVPWSDPLADGPVIQRAAERALASGTHLGAILRALPAIRRACPVPVVLFSYFNPILRLGIDAFAESAAAAGADGVLVTDLPPEESARLREALGRHGLAAVFLATPTSTGARLGAIARASSGFVYAVARTGVTGARTEVHAALTGLLGRIRGHTGLPVAVGFGISRPEQVAALRGHADAFVVGSALVEALEGRGASAAALDDVRGMCRGLLAAGTGAPRA